MTNDETTKTRTTTGLMLGSLGAIGMAAVFAGACPLPVLPLLVAGLTGAGIAHHRQRRELDQLRERLSAALAEVAQARTARTRFLSAAGHDLRQPLHALGLLMAVMRRRNRSARARELVARMEDSLHAAEGLLESLLDVSRLEAGLVHPDPAAVDVDAVIGRVVERLGDEAAAKGLRLTVRRRGLTAISDAALLERILAALVANAIRFTDKGGVLVGCRRRGALLRLEVWDTGIGIGAAQRPHVFEEFYQAANDARDRRRGLGLGLSVAARLADLLGHRLDLRSVPGRGSVFALEMAAAPVPARAPQPQQQRGRAALVAVVDDEPQVLVAMRMVLESWGCEVVAAETIDEALAGLQALDRSPNLVIADFRLRDGRTGAEAIESIRESAHAALPGIIVTGDTAPERLREAAASGCTLLHKPVEAEALRAVVQRALA